VALALILHSVPDSTGPTPGRDTVSPLVKLSDGLDCSTLAARLPPSIFSKLAAAMEALVSERINQFKVFDTVVELIVVAVMDLHAFRNGAVVSFPNKNVLHAVASFWGIPHAAITLGRDVAVSTWSVTLWAGTHDS
jgi:hypothetical protein